MSYTIPEYVDTKEQAVLALASTIADEDKSALGDGSVNRALDVLADTLAGENVDVPQTNAGAILALAQYVGGGGGGAQTTDAYLWNEDTGLSAHGVTAAKYQSGADSFEEVQFEGISTEFEGATIYGVKVIDAPSGARIKLDTASGTIEPIIGYSTAIFPPTEALGPYVPMPIDGLYTVGSYNTDA